MFNLFRSREKSVRIVLGVLLGLVALSMLIYLIPGGPGSMGGTSENVVAEVGNTKITLSDVQRRFDMLTRSQQQQVPRALLAMYVPSVVNQLVTEKAIAYKAEELGITVSDAELATMIRAELAQVSGGKEVDTATYEALLAQQGLTVAGYESGKREQIKGFRLEAAAGQSQIITPEEAKAEYVRTNDKIALDYLALDVKKFEAKVKTDKAALEAYFNKNRSEFRIPEKRSIDLFVGSTAEFLASTKVTDAEVQKRYNDALDSYRTPERVDVRHILIKTQGKPAAEAAKLKAKADDLLKQLKSGGDFAALAKKNSEDPGSGEKGGELGWITRGQTVPNFEKAAFALKPNELSDVITTEYGYHILQAKTHEQAHVRSLDDVKPELTADIQKEQAQAELQKAVSQARLDLIKAPGDAEKIAKTHHLKTYSVAAATREGGLPDVGNQAALINAIFGATKGSTTDVSSIEASGKSAFARVNNIVPEHNAEFAEVEKDVTAKYKQTEGQKAMEDAARAAAKAAKSGQPFKALAKEYNGEVKSAPAFTITGAAEGIGAASILAEAFKVPAGTVTGPYFQGTSAFICKVSEKIPADMNQFAKSKDSVIQSLQSGRSTTFGSVFEDSVVQDLTRRKKIKRNNAVIERLVSSFKS